VVCKEENDLNAHQSFVRQIGFAAVIALMVLGSAIIAGVGNTSAHGGEAHPAHIHTGACPTPGDVVFPLSDVGGPPPDGTPISTDIQGSQAAIPVDFSDTTVQTALADILDGNHAIVVHESKDNIQNYIACGDIGGTVFGGADLAIGLGTVNDSGYSGVAWLHDNGDGTTDVKIFVTENEGASHEAATPGETDAADAGGTAVSIKDFSFGDPIEVAVGTTVTWTNEDTVPHTVTQTGGSGFQSGKLDPGATFSFTFDTAGSFDYFCEFHANMKGTITVK
jgi:plastocyanin